MSAVKLTKPQASLLRWLASTDVQDITDERAVEVLQRHGYAEHWRDDRGIIHFSHAWRITDLGRAALAEEGKRQ